MGQMYDFNKNPHSIVEIFDSNKSGLIDINSIFFDFITEENQRFSDEQLKAILTAKWYVLDFSGNKKIAINRSDIEQFFDCEELDDVDFFSDCVTGMNKLEIANENKVYTQTEGFSWKS